MFTAHIGDCQIICWCLIGVSFSTCAHKITCLFLWYMYMIISLIWLRSCLSRSWVALRHILEELTRMWSVVAVLPSRTSLAPSLCAVSGEIEAVGSFCISDVCKRSLMFSRGEVIVLKFMLTIMKDRLHTLQVAWILWPADWDVPPRFSRTMCCPGMSRWV